MTCVWVRGRAESECKRNEQCESRLGQICFLGLKFSWFLEDFEKISGKEEISSLHQCNAMWQCK